MLVQGPLVPHSTRRGLIPAPVMEDADLAHYRRFTPERFDRWVRAGIHVEGRPDRVFIKLHTHGAEDRNRIALLEEDLPALYEDADRRFNDGSRYRMHYVTARELFNVIRATEEKADGPQERLRDWLLPPPWALPG